MTHSSTRILTLVLAPSQRRRLLIKFWFSGGAGPSGDGLKNPCNFFSGDIRSVDIDRCDHNGCGFVNGEEKWVLHMSGTASCFENNESVIGAIESGDRSANYIAKELGYAVSTESACEDFVVARNRHQRRSVPRWVHRQLHSNQDD
jgi:hypothetical protein